MPLWDSCLLARDWLTFTGTTWVCGDIGQVSLDVYNPMPFELKVSNMVRTLFCAQWLLYLKFNYSLLTHNFITCVHLVQSIYTISISITVFGLFSCIVRCLYIHWLEYDFLVGSVCGGWWIWALSNMPLSSTKGWSSHCHSFRNSKICWTTEDYWSVKWFLHNIKHFHGKVTWNFSFRI